MAKVFAEIGCEIIKLEPNERNMKFYISFSVFLLNFLIIGCASVPTKSEFANIVRNKRAISESETVQDCKTPAGVAGHCLPIQQCDLPQLQQNSLQVLSYLCVLDQKSIGVCCPETTSTRSRPTVFYPQQAADAESAWQARGRDANGMNVRRPEERGCGLATKAMDKIKIVGGKQAEPEEWPWVAALLREGVVNAFCGAVLITDRHVLTAAHCTYKYNKNQIKVRLGEYNFGDKNETRARDFQVTDIRQHADFDETTYDSDIAILKLHAVTWFNTYIWPICMPPPGTTFEGYTAYVIGWGSQFFGGPSSNILMEVSMPIWNQDECQEKFVERIDETQICAGGEERDSCQGDSGGPLMVQLPNKRWVTVGIVSWGIRCGEKYRPGVYTRVNRYSAWIVENAVF